MKKTSFSFLLLSLILLFCLAHFSIVRGQGEEGQVITEEDEQEGPDDLSKEGMEFPGISVSIGGKIGWVEHRHASRLECDSEGSMGFGGWLDLGFSDYFKIREQIMYNRFSVNKESFDWEMDHVYLEGEFRDISSTTLFVFSVPIGESGGSVYLGTGLGFHFLNCNSQLTSYYYPDTLEDSESSTSMGLSVLAGSAIPLGVASLVLEVGYSYVSIRDKGWYNYHIAEQRWGNYHEFLLTGGLQL